MVAISRIHPSGNLKFNNLSIFQSLKLRNFMGKILRISLKLNFTPNTLAVGLKIHGAAVLLVYFCSGDFRSPLL